MARKVASDETKSTSASEQTFAPPADAKRAMPHGSNADEVAEAQRRARNRRVANVVAVALCGAFCLAGVVGNAVLTDARKAALDRQTVDINGLKSRIGTVQAAQAKDGAALLDAVTGLNTARVAEDDEVAERFLKTVTTWSSSAEYTEARKKATSEFGLSEDSQFLTSFMPPVERFDLEGRQFDSIDSYKANMAFVSMQAQVVNISGDRYSYMTTVTVSSANERGETADAQVMVLYTTDPAHKLLDVSAYTLAR